MDGMGQNLGGTRMGTETEEDERTATTDAELEHRARLSDAGEAVQRSLSRLVGVVCVFVYAMSTDCLPCKVSTAFVAGFLCCHVVLRYDRFVRIREHLAPH